MPSDSVDLIYLDPPFFSDRNYEVIWGDDGEVRSFKDRWAGGMDHYIGWLKDRVQEMYRVLKPTGSIYLHCDWHADAYIRVEILDKIFGYDNFKNHVIIHWTAVGLKAKSRKFHQNTETVYFYTKSKKYRHTWNDVFIPATPRKASEHVFNSVKGKAERKRNSEGKIEYFTMDTQKADNFIELVALRGSEKIGYPTQKPEKLLERIIQASSNEGDVILDPFLGGGTTAAVAQRLKRSFIGIDASPIAVAVSEGRLEKQAYESLYIEPFTVITQKYDYHKMRYLDAFEFEKFIVEKSGGVPNTKQRGDMGMDGLINKLPVQVKRSDNIGRNVIDNFSSACQRFDNKLFAKNVAEKNPIGRIIAFSFGKGAIEEVARLKNTDNIIIELVRVEDIIPLSTNPKVEIKIVQQSQTEKGWELSFEATGNQTILQYQWDMDYKDDIFKPEQIYSGENNSKISYTLKKGAYIVACRVTNEDGIHGFETIKIKVNGKVETL